MSLQKVKISTVWALALLAILVFAWPRQTVTAIAGRIPILHNGRVKPLTVFARETLDLVAAKQSWQRQKPIALVLKILASPQEVLHWDFIRLDSLALKKLFGLPAEEKYFSYEKLMPSFPMVEALVHQAQAKRNADERPAKLEQDAELLYSRLMTVSLMSTGEVFRVIPQGEEEAWQSPYASRDPKAGQFKKMMGVYASGDFAEFSKAARAWTKEISAGLPDSFLFRIDLEIAYYKIAPFHYAWILYLAAFIALTFFAARENLNTAGQIALALGFAFHSLGLLLRILILARPPVSNMYESMIFMNWILMAAAGIFFWTSRKTFVLTTAAMISALVMIFADLLPISKSMDVLMPVLRSHYWLMVHVLTIVASYGIFGLTAALAHRHLFRSASGRLSISEEDESAFLLTRLLQMGILTLGVGTILGGVWANESWGRFWGWDPKETWALITFLGYAAVLHLRFSRKINAFGLAIFCLAGFWLVLMTWYGVNFLLGKGLHSYGSGAGGVSWIILYLLFEAGFCAFVFFKKGRRTGQLGGL